MKKLIHATLAVLAGLALSPQTAKADWLYSGNRITDGNGWSLTVESAGGNNLRITWRDGIASVLDLSLPVKDGSGNSYNIVAITGGSFGVTYTELKFPETLHTLGGNLFTGAKINCDLVIPPNVTTFGQQVFYGNGTEINGTLTMGGGNNISFGSSVFHQTVIENLVILAGPVLATAGTFGSANVRGNATIHADIGDFAVFNDFKCGGTLSLGGSVGANAFGPVQTGGSTVGGDVVFLPGASHIGANAFKGLKVGGDVTMASTVAAISASAFENSVITGALTLGGGLEIKADAFKGAAIGSLLVRASNPVASPTVIGSGAFQSCVFGNGVVMQPGVVSIGANAFNNATINSDLDIPDTVSVIGASGFYNVKNVAALALGGGDGVDIKAEAFRSATIGSLFIRASDHVTSPTVIGENAFRSCTFGSVVMQTGVASIGAAAFHNITVNGNATLSPSLASIGSEAFQTSTITGVLTLGGGAALQPPVSLAIGANAFYADAQGKFGGLVMLPGVATIGASAFQGVSILGGNLDIPDTVSVIHSGAFSHAKCGGAALTLGGGGGVDIREDAFRSAAFASVYIRESHPVTSPTSIGKHAFGYLTVGGGGLYIPYGVTNIATSAFTDSKGFDGDLIIGEGVRHIGGQAFHGVKFGGILVIPSSVESIESQSFYNAIFSEIYLQCSQAAFRGSGDIFNADALKHVPWLNVARGLDWHESPMFGSGSGYHFKSSFTNAQNQVVEGYPSVTTALEERDARSNLIGIYLKFGYGEPPLTYTVRFNANTGPGNSNLMPDRQFIYNVSYALPRNQYYRYGYAFLGWSTTPGGNVEYFDGQFVNNLVEIGMRRITLYAVWQLALDDDDEDHYVVLFYRNGAEGGNMNPWHRSSTNGMENLPAYGYSKFGYEFINWIMAIPDGMAIPNWAREVDYDFLVALGVELPEWLMDEEGELLPTRLVEFTDAAPVGDLAALAGSRVVTLFANWLFDEDGVIITHTIHFDGNGGDGFMPSWTRVNSVPMRLPPNTFKAPEGMAFGGWTLHPDEPHIEYVNGELIGDLVIGASGDVTLWAVWVMAQTFLVTPPANTSIEPDTATHGENYNGALTADEGYDLPPSVTITIGGEPLTEGEDFTYCPETGDLWISKDVIGGGEIVISGTAPKTRYTVKPPANTSVDPTDVEHGSDYEGTLLADEGFDLPPSVTITIGGEPLTEGEDFTYDPETGDLWISKDVIGGGEIVISGTAPKTRYTVKPPANTSVDPSDVEHGSDYEGALTADEGYDLPPSVTITIGGKPLEEGMDFTYDPNTGDIWISKDVIGGGEIVISGTAPKTRYTVKPPANTTLDPTDVEHGSDYDGALTADEGFDLPPSVTITVGGEPLTEGEDFTYDPNTGDLWISKDVIGDEIIISGTAPKTKYLITPPDNASVDPQTATHGEDYMGQLTADEGYVLPATINVTIGETWLDEGDFTYDHETGELTINGALINGGEITIHGRVTEIVVLGDIFIEPAVTVESGNVTIGRFTPPEGYDYDEDYIVAIIIGGDDENHLHGRVNKSGDIIVNGDALPTGYGLHIEIIISLGEKPLGCCPGLKIMGWGDGFIDILAPTESANLCITGIRVFTDSEGEWVEIKVDGCLNFTRSYALFGHPTEVAKSAGERYEYDSPCATYSPTREEALETNTEGAHVFKFEKPGFDTYFFHLRELKR